MDATTRATLDDLWSTDGDRRPRALTAILEETSRPVDWAYEVWDDLLDTLRTGDNQERSIASQLLCHLAVSDPDGRMLKDFDAVLAVTRDERFVTARHCLQALWTIGLAGPKQKKTVVDGLARRFADCGPEKNCTLIRYDIIVGLKKLYDAVADEKVRDMALRLIGTEDDLKYRKKYAAVWRGT